METRILMAVPILLALGIGTAAAQQKGKRGGAGIPAPIKIMIAGYSDGGEIPAKNTCAANPSAGSPMIEWSGAPANTAAYAIIFHDADVAPRKTTEDVTHWIIWNIPGSSHELPAGVPSKADLEDGARQGKNIANMTGYFGPCPPPGLPHHYILEMYALDQKLDLPDTANRADLEKALDGHIIAKGVYYGLFKRP